MTSLIQQYAALRDKRIRAQREVDMIYESEQLLKEQLIGEMLTKRHNIVLEGSYQLLLTEKVIPVATDWPALLDYIRESGQIDLLHRRLTESAINARWAEGQAVPGVAAQTKYDIKLKEIN